LLVRQLLAHHLDLLHEFSIVLLEPPILLDQLVETFQQRRVIDLGCTVR
jgi:hypothetical protein